MHEKGLFIIDIVTFLKTFGIQSNYSNLHESFLTEEKDYVLKKADLKLRELKLSNNVDEFCSLFSEFDNIGKAKRSSEMHNMHQTHSHKSKNNTSMFDVINRTVNTTKKYIDDEMNSYVKDN